MKNVQCRYSIYGNSETILYYPYRSSKPKIFIGCQEFTEEQALSYLAVILGYELNFMTIKKGHKLKQIISNYHDTIRLLKNDGSLNTLFKLICKEKGIEIK